MRRTEAAHSTRLIRRFRETIQLALSLPLLHILDLEVRVLIDGDDVLGCRICFSVCKVFGQHSGQSAIDCGPMVSVVLFFVCFAVR
jgi:hypothetical protein